MDKSQKKYNNDEDDEDDCKPSAQEKKQANDDKDIIDSEEDEPMKKKRSMESFCLGCEVLCQHIEFNDGDAVYFDKLPLQKEAQDAYPRLVELDAPKREYQWTISAYEDL